LRTFQRKKIFRSINFVFWFAKKKLSIEIKNIFQSINVIFVKSVK